MKKNIKYILPLLFIVLVVAGSYAFFTARSNVTEQTIGADAAQVILEYTDCADSNQSDCANISTELKPGDSVTKTFKVENTGDIETEFAIVFKELENTFLHDELVYTLYDITDGEVVVSETPVPYADTLSTNDLILNDISIDTNETKTYRLTITFKDTDDNQNYNSNAGFSIKLGIRRKRSTAILPGRYQQVEYIESNGTQYIDTGVIFNYDLQTEIDFQYTQLTTVNGFVAGVNNAGCRYYVFQLQNSGTRWRSAGTNNLEVFSSSSDKNRHSIVYNNENHRVYFDGINKGTLPSYTYTGNYTLYLFAMSSSGTAQEYGVLRMFSCKLTDTSTGTILRDFIPCYRKTDTVAGLYDIVHDVFYPCSKPGVNFTAGPIVE